MLTRILTSIVAVMVLLPVLFFSDTVIFPIALAVVSVICLYEIFKCTGFHKRFDLIVPIYLVAIVIPFLIRYWKHGEEVAQIAFIVAAVYFIYLLARIIWSHGKIPFNEGISLYAISLYIIAALSSILYIRDFKHGGEYIYLLIFIGAWVTDIFAYFTGYFIGKHKLIEDVSPKKTIEGSIGGIVFCAASFVVFGLIIDAFFDGDANWLFLLIAGIIISIISQIGDLIMSVIKRHYNIKDYGKIFPGHGGMLDRFDSILAVSLGLCAICMFASISGISLV